MPIEYSEGEILRLAWDRWAIKLVKGSRTFSGSCPHCGGEDRFVVWPRGNFMCRGCSRKGWLEEGKTFTPAEKQERAEELARVERAEHQHQAEILEAWQHGYKAGYAGGWHAALTAKHREHWHSQGIKDWAIEEYQLGYCESRRWRGREGTFFESDAYTLPVREPVGGKLINVQYRLINLPPGERGKYRQESDLPAAAFHAEIGKLEGPVLVVEGSKKAIVLYDLMDRKVQVVGMPSAMPDEKLIMGLGKYDGVWLALDPDVQKLRKSGYAAALQRYAEKLPKGMVREISLPDKPDDMVVLYGMDRDGFRSAWAQARRVD